MYRWKCTSNGCIDGYAHQMRIGIGCIDGNVHQNEDLGFGK